MDDLFGTLKLNGRVHIAGKAHQTSRQTHQAVHEGHQLGHLGHLDHFGGIQTYAATQHQSTHHPRHAGRTDTRTQHRG